MSGPDTPGDETWLSLIREFQQLLGFESDSDTTPPVTSQTEHGDAVARLCNQYREREVPRLLNRIRRQHARMIVFTATIDQANNLQSPNSLESLLWQLLTGAIKAAFEAGQRLSDFLKETEKLNDLVPSFNRELLRTFSHDPKVQAPLQNIFKLYMNCYLSMFQEVATFPSALCLGVFTGRTLQTKDLLTQSHADWELALQVAEAERQQALQSNTITSLPKGALETPFRNQGINAQFVYEAHLGKGSSGEVVKVKERTTGIFYAQKLFRVGNRYDTGRMQSLEKQVIEEYKTMQKLRHDHISSVSFYVRDVSAFSIIMLPVADCDLGTFLENPDGLKKEDRRHLDTWFGCLICALAFAHEKDIKHADIKPANILIKDNRPYLADFSSAKDFSDNHISTSSEYQTRGTPVYWPPENLESRGRPAYIFALGCVFSEMLTVRQKRTLADYREARRVPGLDYGWSFKENLPGIAQWLNELPDIGDEDPASTLVLETIHKMLKPSADDRPGAKKIKKTFRQEEDLLFCPTCT